MADLEVTLTHNEFKQQLNLLGVITMHFYKLLGLKTQIRPKQSINKRIDNICPSEILFDEIILNLISCIGKKKKFYFFLNQEKQLIQMNYKNHPI